MRTMIISVGFFALLLLCGCPSPPPPPPPPPCEFERQEWPECEASGGTWVEQVSGCSCSCPSGGVFIEDKGCVVPLPRVDRLCPLDEVTGVTAFGMTLLDEEQIIAFVEHIQKAGYNTLRVGAQTDGWCDMGVSYLPCGPEFGSVEWEENLRQLLDVTSRIPDVWIQLIPTFTRKQDAGGLPHFMALTEQVIAIQQAGTSDDPRPFFHIVWEAANEYIHPISNIRHRHIKRLLERLRETGLPVGVDRAWRDGYPEDLLPLVDFIAFHTPRYDWSDGVCTSELPGPNRLRKIIARYNRPVWIDETVKFVSDWSKEYYEIGRGGGYANCGGGSENQRKRIVREFKEEVETAGGIFFAHCTWLFECKNLGWLP